MTEEKEHKEGTCWLCGIEILRWDSTDLRASELGSFVAVDNTVECPDGRLHQG